MSIFTFTQRPPLRSPALVICLNGWVNAGSAATLVADTLGGELLADAEPDLLFDYRVSRPTLDFIEGVMTSLVWPSISLRWLTLAERDLRAHAPSLGTETPRNGFHMAVELGVTEQDHRGDTLACPPAVKSRTARTAISPQCRKPRRLLRVPRRR